MLSFDALDTGHDEVLRRRVCARRAGHPYFLWPEVPVDEWRAATRALAEATSAVLRGRVPRIVLDDVRSLDAWKVALFTSGLGPIIGYWIEAGRMQADEGMAALAVLHFRHGARRRQRVEETVQSVASGLHEAGIMPIVFLKGVDTAVHHFPHPATRPAVDVDVLVPPEDLSGVRRVLATLGMEPRERIRHPFREEWRRRGEATRLRSVFITHGDDPVPVDLHTSLTRSFSGTRDVTPKVGPSDICPAPALGLKAQVLSDPLRAAYLALHGGDELKQLQLLKLVEIRFVITASAFQWDAVYRILEECDGVAHAWPAFHMTEALVPGTVDADFLATLRASAPPRLRRIVDGLAPWTVQEIIHERLSRRFMWAQTPAEFLRCAGNLVRPSRTNAGASGRVWQERLHRLRRGAIKLR